MSALREAFVDELKDLLDAERQLLKALPKMAKAAENEQLRAAFLEHQQQTEQQIRRLGRVFEAFEEPPNGKKCKAMHGLVAEAEDIMKKSEGDAALIGAAQKAEHYEIAAYGTLASWSVALGHDEVLQVLNEILEEEKETDKKLTVIAQSVVNSYDSQHEAEEQAAPKRRRTTGVSARRTRKPTANAGRKTRSRSRTRNSAARSQAARGPRSKRLRARASK
jgi:ferritin-like metal-binding protein YciE